MDYLVLRCVAGGFGCRSRRRLRSRSLLEENQLLNWQRDPDVESKIAESRIRAQQLKNETEQIRSENALLNEKLRNFRDLELSL